METKVLTVPNNECAISFEEAQSIREEFGKKVLPTRYNNGGESFYKLDKVETDTFTRQLLVNFDRIGLGEIKGRELSEFLVKTEGLAIGVSNKRGESRFETLVCDDPKLRDLAKIVYMVTKAVALLEGNLPPVSQEGKRWDSDPAKRDDEAVDCCDQARGMIKVLGDSEYKENLTRYYNAAVERIEGSRPDLSHRRQKGEVILSLPDID